MLLITPSRWTLTESSRQVGLLVGAPPTEVSSEPAPQTGDAQLLISAPALTDCASDPANSFPKVAQGSKQRLPRQRSNGCNRIRPSSGHARRSQRRGRDEKNQESITSSSNLRKSRLRSTDQPAVASDPDSSREMPPLPLHAALHRFAVQCTPYQERRCTRPPKTSRMLRCLGLEQLHATETHCGPRKFRSHC
jgi:hypothetical protein